MAPGAALALHRRRGRTRLPVGLRREIRLGEIWDSRTQLQKLPVACVFCLNQQPTGVQKVSGVLFKSPKGAQNSRPVGIPPFRGRGTGDRVGILGHAAMPWAV